VSCHQGHREHPICDAFDQSQAENQKPWSPAERDAEQNGICLREVAAADRGAKHNREDFDFSRGQAQPSGIYVAAGSLVAWATVRIGLI